MFKTWKTIKSFFPSFSTKSSTPEKIKHNDEILSNPQNVAKNVCDYFSKTGLKLASKNLCMMIMLLRLTSETDYLHFRFFALQLILKYC